MLLLENILIFYIRLVHQISTIYLLAFYFANCICLVNFTAIKAPRDDAVSTDENSLHKFQTARRHCTAFVANAGRSARGWAVGSGGSPINHPLTNCRTGRFARNIGSARLGRAVFLPAVFLRERRLPQCGLRKKDPAGSTRAAEARKPRKWGITVFITRPLSVRLMEVRPISIFDIAGRLSACAGLFPRIKG